MTSASKSKIVKLQASQRGVLASGKHAAKIQKAASYGLALNRCCSCCPLLLLSLLLFSSHLLLKCIDRIFVFNWTFFNIFIFNRYSSFVCFLMQNWGVSHKYVTYVCLCMCKCANILFLSWGVFFTRFMLLYSIVNNSLKLKKLNKKLCSKIL